MKLYAIVILQPRKDNKTAGTAENTAPNALRSCSAVDVSSFGFFQRYSAKEFIFFLSRLVASKITLNGAKTQVTESDYCCFAVSSSVATSGGSPIVAVAIADIEYNNRVAFTMLNEVLLNFQRTFKNKYEYALVSNPPAQDDYLSPWAYLDDMLAKYQKPEEVDKILKIQRDIEDTKIIMYNAVDQMLARGEKIDTIVANTEDLSMASKTFYDQAKQTNSGCCSVM
ncbi:synaptobrevin like protein YKT6 [Angomonas deanei]|nr:synaptobrevin like protein YKT6 [Angomonas deanei]|eukprot:EPY38289.1 synaptobrevin like protein YKT6 [Angomonas deanei]